MPLLESGKFDCKLDIKEGWQQTDVKELEKEMKDIAKLFKTNKT